MKKTSRLFIIIVSIVVVALVSFIGGNTIFNYYSLNRAFSLKIICHDEAVRYRDDKNKEYHNPDLGIIPAYRLINSGYNQQHNTCLGYFEYTHFKLDGKTIMQEEDVVDVLNNSNTNIAVWYGDAANLHIEKGSGWTDWPHQTMIKSYYDGWLPTIGNLGLGYD